MGEPLECRAFVCSVCVLGLIQYSEDLKILRLGDRVELVGVALRAGHRDPHPDRHGGVDAIDDSYVTKLFVVGATLIVGQCVAMKGGGHQLLVRWVGEQISSQLFDGKLIEGHTVVDGFDDPVAIGPNRSGRIVGIAC